MSSPTGFETRHPRGRLTQRVALAILCFVFAGSIARAGWFSDPPNVVLICIDTVRKDTFDLPETSKSPDALSPWITRALRFENAHSPAPWTVPAVASTLTGLYPIQHRAGLYTEQPADLTVDPPSGLVPSVVTLPELLPDHTMMAFTESAFLKPQYALLQRGPVVFVDTEKRKASAADEALAWLKRRKEKGPFFLYLHLMDAHHRDDQVLADALAGRAAPVATREMRKSAAALPPKILASVSRHPFCANRKSYPCTVYLDYVSAVLDTRRHVAAVLGELQRGKRLGRTIVVLFSDHGEEFGEHMAEEAARGGDPRGHYGIGHGHAMYEELLHVPLYIWKPSQRPASVTAPVSLIDVTPTLAAWLDVDPIATWSGVVLSDAVLAGTSHELDGRVLYASGIAYGYDQSAVMTKGKALIDIRCPPEHLLFNLSGDPAERHPLRDSAAIDDQRRLLIRYSKLWQAPSSAPPELTTEERKQLQALGYLEGSSDDAGPAPCEAATPATPR